MKGAIHRTLPGIFVLIPAMLFTPPVWANLSPPPGQVMDIVAKMEAVYAGVEGYQTETEVNEYREGRVVTTKRFLYTFKKPDHLRIDMESPYRGMVLVYPDEDGKVTVRPGGWSGFLKLHLSPDSALLRTSAGQRIDQTDLGLLIRHIRHSLTDLRRGDIKVTGEGGRVLVEVLAKDHFRPGLTLYRFFIDTTRWLPVEVQELTQDGVPKRKVIFRDLRIRGDIPDSFFHIDGGIQDDRPGR